MSHYPHFLGDAHVYSITAFHPLTAVPARYGLMTIADRIIMELTSWGPFPGDQYITFPSPLKHRFQLRLSWDRIYFYVYDHGVQDHVTIPTVTLARRMGRGVGDTFASIRQDQFLNCRLKDRMVRSNIKAQLEKCLNSPGVRSQLGHLCEQEVRWRAVDLDDAHQIGLRGHTSYGQRVTIKVSRQELLDPDFNAAAKVATELHVKHAIINSLLQYGPASSSPESVEIGGHIWKIADESDDVIYIKNRLDEVSFRLERRLLSSPGFEAGQWVQREYNRMFCHAGCVYASVGHSFYRGMCIA